MKRKKAPKRPKRKVRRKKQPVSKVPKIKLSLISNCPECGADNIFYSQIRDEIICRDCGGIFSELTPEQMKKFSIVSDVI
ncbi:hypothetical protein HYU13_02750 [Candidatus Woesearchaeota archaeon]|nr:hypothetical protein [Candidatus Woesearchaeota archaeon]